MSTVPQVVVDGDPAIVLANREARRLLGLGSAEVGHPISEASTGLRAADLRGALDHALPKRQEVTLQDVVSDSRQDSSGTFDVVISPLEGHGGAVLAFLDISR